jgi:hypothetical protein
MCYDSRHLHDVFTGQSLTRDKRLTGSLLWGCEVTEKLSERIRNVVQDGNLNFLLGSGLSRPFLATLGNIEHPLPRSEPPVVEPHSPVNG